MTGLNWSSARWWVSSRAPSCGIDSCRLEPSCTGEQLSEISELCDIETAIESHFVYIYIIYDDIYRCGRYIFQTSYLSFLVYRMSRLLDLLVYSLSRISWIQAWCTWWAESTMPLRWGTAFFRFVAFELDLWSRSEYSCVSWGHYCRIRLELNRMLWICFSCQKVEGDSNKLQFGKMNVRQGGRRRIRDLPILQRGGVSVLPFSGVHLTVAAESCKGRIFGGLLQVPRKTLWCHLRCVLAVAEGDFLICFEYFSLRISVLWL